MRSSLLILCLFSLLWPLSRAPAVIRARNDRAELEFPERVVFSVDLQSSVDIEHVVLEYGTERLTCGTVIAKAFPVFEPASKVHVAWTWEMKQSGSEPPGATLWWRWRVIDADGDELVTKRQTVVWLDDEHHWQVTAADNIRLHWYGEVRAYARDLRTAAVRALADLEQKTGLEPEAPIDLYIYPNVQDMREAVFYEAGWTGGQAYAPYNLIIIGIAPDQVEWGKKTIAHELAHILAGRFAFGCLGNIPTWLTEGVAMYAEGGLDEAEQQALDAAIADDTIISVRALSGNFPEAAARAGLAYAQSYSLVDFLIAQYGREKLLALLRALSVGQTADAALRELYGFDVDGLEAAWRRAVGAAVSATARATATPRPSPVPTYVLAVSVPVAPTFTPAVSATGSAAGGLSVGGRTFPRQTVVIIAAAAVGVGVLLAIVLVVAAYRKGN